MAKLPNGDKTGPKTALRTSLDTLRSTLLLPATTEHRKLPKATTPLLTTIHTSWIKFTTPDNLPSHRPNSYDNLMNTSTATVNPNKRPVTHIPEILLHPKHLTPPHYTQWK